MDKLHRVEASINRTIPRSKTKRLGRVTITPQEVSYLPGRTTHPHLIKVSNNRIHTAISMVLKTTTNNNSGDNRIRTNILKIIGTRIKEEDLLNSGQAKVMDKEVVQPIKEVVLCTATNKTIKAKLRWEATINLFNAQTQ